MQRPCAGGAPLQVALFETEAQRARAGTYGPPARKRVYEWHLMGAQKVRSGSRCGALRRALDVHAAQTHRNRVINSTSDRSSVRGPARHTRAASPTPKSPAAPHREGRMPQWTLMPIL